MTRASAVAAVAPLPAEASPATVGLRFSVGTTVAFDGGVPAPHSHFLLLLVYLLPALVDPERPRGA